MMRYKDIIAPTTDAAEELVDMEPSRGVGVAVQSINDLEGSETITIEQMGATENDWLPVKGLEGPVQLTSDRNRLDCLSRGTFNINKTATANPVGVRIWFAS